MYNYDLIFIFQFFSLDKDIVIAANRCNDACFSLIKEQSASRQPMQRKKHLQLKLQR